MSDVIKINGEMTPPQAILLGLIIAVCFIVIVMSFAYQQQQIRPSEEFSKTIQIKAIYPRIDAYVNHMPPYIITKDGEIFDVPDSLIWAKFDVDGSYKIRYSIVKISGRTGTILGIEEST